MTIGERIGALRRAAGLSQERLAEQLGVSRQAIGKWEAGASLPGVDNLQELARALGAVSYTHLDVYKRQAPTWSRWRRAASWHSAAF